MCSLSEHLAISSSLILTLSTLSQWPRSLDVKEIDWTKDLGREVVASNLWTNQIYHLSIRSNKTNQGTIVYLKKVIKLIKTVSFLWRFTMFLLRSPLKSFILVFIWNIKHTAGCAVSQLGHENILNGIGEWFDGKKYNSKTPFLHVLCIQVWDKQILLVHIISIYLIGTFFGLALHDLGNIRNYSTKLFR